ncbi:MAG: prepilin-type N-terminal cleavage/methylation domain-containing protein [Acidobacteria bacterium]|nr:prepilin-type N-terminal cleavage/methylation domain-containing protein [Acidobacteriota bacterium]
MSVSSNRKNRGFTLIELLIVVAIIGIIAAISIPNMLHALHMARQKRSLSDLRTIAMALAVYNNDHNHYPILGETNHMALVPFLGDQLPKWDGWNNLFSYESGDGSIYTAVCYGSNRTPDVPYTLGPIRRHRDDIVFIDSQLFQWPDGTQGE